MPKRLLLYSCFIFFLSCQPKRTVKPQIKSWVDYRRAYAWLSSNKDSAFYYFNRLVTTSKDSQQIAMAFTNMSMIQSDAGDYFGSEESLIQSLHYQNPHDLKQQDAIAANYNELGTASFNLKNYQAAVESDEEALKFAVNSEFRATISNNMAAAYRSVNQYAKALRIYRKLIHTASPKSIDYARLLTNMENTKWLQNPTYNAAPGLLVSMHIRKRENDYWGLSSSYAHLADFYQFRNPDSARYFARAMYHTALQIGNPDEQLLALARLMELAPNQQVRNYSLRYRSLNDSLQMARSKAKNQFALIRYESEKRKVDNLNLLKDNSEKKYQLIRERVTIYSILCVFLITIFLGVFWFKKRRRVAEQEKRAAIVESNQKASKKVHDTLANDLYRLMKTVQYNTITEKEWLVDNLDDVYQRARNLSYTITDDIPDFDIKLSELIKSFASDNIRVNILGNRNALWQNVPGPIKTELRYIFQELMVNMQKHSSATDVVFRFEQQANRGIVVYHDNGIGMRKGIRFNNGLTNAENRMKAIGGKISFDTDPKKGLFIHMSFPLT